MQRRLALTLGLAVLLVATLVGSALAAGALHFTWGSGWPYGAPAAAVVNKAGAVVWWTVPSTSVHYKDVYRSKPADGFSPWPVSGLNEPVRTIVINCLGYQVNDTIFYSRETIPVEEIPSFPNGTVITNLAEVCAS